MKKADGELDAALDSGQWMVDDGQCKTTARINSIKSISLLVLFLFNILIHPSSFILSPRSSFLVASSAW
jgi:hypothetical protein